LFDNAIKFTSEGTVTLSACVIRQHGELPLLQFAVNDTGIGMSQAEMGPLFQPFYRIRSADQAAPRGAGLGLAICERIAGRLGGKITVTSTPGEGSTFVLSIPIGSPNEGDASRQSADSNVNEQPAAVGSSRLDARILVADDNEANRQLISLRLRRAGAEVEMASDGKEALDKTRESLEQGRPFDAIIMDMQMPVLDGYEAVRELRARGFTRPIVAVTAYAMSADREECLQLGCDEFVSKPIEWERFLSILERLLRTN
jgi:CheY-like chemotaxis protein